MMEFSAVRFMVATTVRAYTDRVVVGVRVRVCTNTRENERYVPEACSWP